MSPFYWLVQEISLCLLAVAAIFYWIGTLTAKRQPAELAPATHLAEISNPAPSPADAKPAESKPLSSALPVDAIPRSELIEAQANATRYQQDAAKYQAEATRQSTLVADLRGDQKVLLTQIAELRSAAANGTPSSEAEQRQLAQAMEQQAKLESELTAAREALTKAEIQATEQRAKLEAELAVAREAQARVQGQASEYQAKLEAELAVAREARIKAEAHSAEQQMKIHEAEAQLANVLASSSASVAPERKRKAVRPTMDPSMDDLTAIKGIGKVLNQRLSDCGITTFHQIATWTPKDIEHFDKQLALKGRVLREQWLDQAQQLQRQKQA